MPDSSIKQFVFNPKMYGLPNSSILGANDKPQEVVLRKVLCLNRQQENIVKRDHKSNANKLQTHFTAPRFVFINTIANPAYRKVLASRTAEAIIEEVSKKSKDRNKTSSKNSGFSVANWELLILKKYAFELWEFIPSEEINKTNDRVGGNYYELDPHVVLILEKIKERAFDEIKDWDKFPGIKKSELADVFFALGMTLDIDILNRAVAAQGGLKKYYSLITSNEYNCEIRAKSERKEDIDDEVLIDYSSSEEYLQAIESLIAKAKDAPRDASITSDLLKVAKALNEWVENNPQVVSQHECIIKLLDILYTLGHEIKLDGFIDDSGSIPFKSIWYSYLSSTEVEQIHNDALVKLLNKGEDTINRLSEMITHLKTEIKSLMNRIDKLIQQQPVKRTARRLLTDEVTSLHTKVQEYKNRLFEIEDEAILSLLPPGSNIEKLESINERDIPEEDAIPEAMFTALQGVYSYIESGFVSTLDEEDPKDIGCENGDLHNENIRSLDTFQQDKDNVNIVDVIANVEGASSNIDQIETDDGKVSEATGECSSANQKPDNETSDLDQVTPVKEFDDSSDLAGEGSNEIEQLQLKCIAQLNEQGYIDGSLMNQAIMGLLVKNRIETAFGLARLIDENEFSRYALPAELLKGAYYGAHNWTVGRTLNKSRKTLTSFSAATIEEWSEIRGAGKAVPFLIFVACFQPTLFGGKYSNAPDLLRTTVKHGFEGPAGRLISSSINLANHNNVITLGNLRSGGKEVNQERVIDFTQKVDSWSQKIRNRRGYAPILKAQTYCLEKGLFADINEILRSNNRSNMGTIKEFVLTYQDRRASDQLLNEILIASRQDLPSGSILSQGKLQFFHKVSELIEIAQNWLGQFEHQGSEVEEYCRKFTTLLPQVIKQFHSIVEDPNQSLELQAGANVAVNSLENLRRVIDGNDAPDWEYERVKAWMYYPEQIIRLQSVEKNPLEQLNWYLSQVDNPITYNEALDLASTKDDIAIRFLMYMSLKDVGDDRKSIKDDLKIRFSQHRLDLHKDCKRLETRVDNAVMSLLIDPNRSENLIAELGELQDTIGRLKQYSPTQDIQDQIKTIRDEIDRETANRRKELEDEYNTELEKMKTSLSGDPVPDEWITTMQSAISDCNFPVIDEMLDELQTARREGQPIRFSKIRQISILCNFLSSEEEIYQGIKNQFNSKRIWQTICASDKSCFGLNFTTKHSNLKKVIESFCSLGKQRPPKYLDQSYYDQVATVLAFVGLEFVDKTFKGTQKEVYGYRLGEGFVALHISVKATETGRPFPIFSETNTLPVIIAFKEWSPEMLEAYQRSIELIGTKPILISGVPLSNSQRNKFANYFKCSKGTLLHIDLTMVLFLGSLNNTAENSGIRNFLWLTLPWTYFNPYVAGGTTFPPPIEMRYGRDTEINRLLEMNNGHAIVYGGRQLGKSTILQQVKNNFHKPTQKKLAFYRMLDKHMDRMSINKEHWNEARRIVWKSIYDDLESSGLIKRSDSELNPEQMASLIEKALSDNKDYKIIVIFDEIDPILNVDNAHDFGIFRGIRELVSKPEIQGRFKLIIAGLENVKRFENSPNYPLNQLGGSMQVSIMSTQDALYLIKEPLFAAGYKFENPQIANRILTITNRHPGMMQVFCHELIASLATSKRDDIGYQIITDDDISNVQDKEDVIDLIRERFDMTLNLDRRYLIIIYGLLNEKKSTRPFTVKEAHEIASSWLPEEFQKLGIKQFEAFLTELCGLGVLKAIKEVQSIKYALRNTNILKLLVHDDDEIIHKLEIALKLQTQSSPLDRHAFFTDKMLACPITFRDEKNLLGSEIKDNEINHIKQEGSWKYTTTIIVGSEALGNTNLATTLPNLYEIERLEHPDIKLLPDEYELFMRNDADFESPMRFQNIMESMLKTKSQEKPLMILVNVTGNSPIAHFLGLLDAAHGLNSIANDIKYPVRLVFSLSPNAYWQWLSHPELTDDREQSQPFIILAPWHISAVAHLLDKLDMVNTPTDIDKLMSYSEGWYLSLNILCQIKKAHPNLNNLSSSSDKYVAMTNIGLIDAKKFIDASGIKDVPWVEPLIKIIIEDWNDQKISLEEIELSAREIGDFQNGIIGIKPAIKWLIVLNILQRVRITGSPETRYITNPSIVHALDVVSVS